MFAQDVYTLDKCREMATSNNTSNSIAKENIAKAQYTLNSYRANYLPKFSVAGTYMYSNQTFSKTITGGYLPTFVPDPQTGALTPNILGMGPDGSIIFKEYAYMPDIPFELKFDGIYNFRISVEQPIFMGGKIVAANKMASIGRDVSRLQQTLTRSQVIEECDKAYWTCVKAGQMLVLAQKYCDMLNELSKNVENAVNVGMVHNKELLTVRVKQNEAELSLRKAQNGVRLATMNLCYTIGIPMTSKIAVADSFEGMEQAIIPDGVDISSRPEYAMLSKQVDLKKYQERLVRSDYLPNLGVMAMYGYTNGVKLNNEKIIDGSSVVALASLKIPIFHWGEGYNKIRAAKSERKIAQMQMDDLSRKMELEANQAMNAMDEALFEVTMTRKSLSQAEESMKVCKDQYEVGLETLANYLMSQTSWQKAYADYIAAQADLQLSKTVYLKTIGKL